MKNRTAPLLPCCTAFAVALAVALAGCSSSSNIETVTTENRKPEMNFRVASLDLSGLKRRIEKKDIAQLAKTLKDQQIDALAVQNISRYPEVSTRLDFVDECSLRTGWRSAFGEMSNINGHQTGNAVFSSFPILAHYVIPFEGESSFESALQANIDAGVGSLTVISAQLPPKADNAALEKCFRRLTADAGEQKNPMFVLTGNLPSSEQFTPSKDLEPVTAAQKNTSPGMWKIKNPSLRVAATTNIRTTLGTMILTQFELYRPE
jgi:hypothetical protein